MKLNVGLIANSLPYVTQNVYTQLDQPLAISDIRLLHSECSLYSEDILYFSEWPALKKLAGNCPAYAVCVGGGKDAEEFFKESGKQGIILEPVNPALAFGIIQSIFLHYNQLEQRLMKSILLKEPMQEILNCCSEYFQDQVVLFDDMLNIIDFSTNYPPDDDDPIWKEMCQTKKRSEKLFQQTRKMNPQFDPIDSPCSELIDPGAGYPRNLYNSFYDSARRFASLMILENNKPISFCQLKLLDYISELIGSSLFDRYSTLHGSVENLRAAFVMFLNKYNVDPAIVSRCLGLKGWGMRDDYRLILINLPDIARNTDTLTRYLYIYENIFPDCLGFKYIESIVIVIHNDTEEVMAGCMPKLERQLKMHNAVCGVSLPFNSISQINSQYINAGKAIQFGDKTQRVCYLKDIITSYLINKIASDTPLIPLCSREAMRIYDYDIENGTELLLTIETYLRQNKSQKAAADDLFICRSTLAYRLGCIEKLAKIDFDNSNERLHFLLSCIVLRYLGKQQIGPPIKTTRETRGKHKT